MKIGQIQIGHIQFIIDFGAVISNQQNSCQSL